MEVLVFSDTHGSSERMLEVIESRPKANAVFFLGDGARDADDVEMAFPRLPLYRVSGNCDFGRYEPQEGLVAFDGVLFYYTHGHLAGVKHGLDELYAIARRTGADVAMFGHTHKPEYREMGDKIMFNPGSLTLPRGGSATYGVITIKESKPTFEIICY